MDMETGSQPGPAEDSLHADIASAFEASENTSTESTTTTTEAKTPDVSEAARTLAAARKAAATTEQTTDPAKPAPVDDKTKTATTETTATAEVIEAPAHWPAEIREMFGKQSPEAKKWLLDRHKSMEADYTRKTQEFAPMRQLRAELDDIFKNHRETMALNGVSEAQAIRQLVAAHDMLQRDPANGMQRLASQYGIDLKALVDGAAAADPAGESPLVKEMRRELQELRAWREQSTTQQTQQQTQAHLTEVTQFAEAKDAQGNPLRPDFDELSQDISLLLRAARQGGQPISLQDAYDRARYANPQTRAKVLAAQDAQRRATEEAERKAKADAAKKAGFDVKGEGAATTVVANNDSIRASLTAAFDTAEGRV